MNLTYEERIRLIKAKAVLEHAMKLSQASKNGSMTKEQWLEWMEVNVKPVIMSLPVDIVMKALDRIDQKREEAKKEKDLI
jgi:hypothetical protein